MQEEEPSVSEILSSIRQVLSKEAEALSNGAVREFDEESFDVFPEKRKIDKTTLNDFIVELTPQMRINNESLLSAETTFKTQAALEKLNQLKSNDMFKPQVEAELKPMLREWLNIHLPEIVERIVTQEVKRLINKS